MYHFREYFELTNAYTNTPLIQENTSHKKTLPSSGNIHYLSSYRSFLINFLTSFDYSNSNSMTCQFHKEVEWCLEMPPTWLNIRWAIWTNIALPRKVWKMNFNFPGWYITDWFCAVRIVPVWPECKAVLSLVQKKRKCMLQWLSILSIHNKKKESGILRI